MTVRILTRRRLLGGLAAAGLVGSLPAGLRAAPPYRIYMITFRGETDVERGFRDYLAQRHIEAEFVQRDAERDATRVAGFVEEIRQLAPDLVYTWGTPVTLATVGPYDAADPAKYITDRPVVFTMVAAPVKAKVVPSLQSSGRNVTGAFHVVPTEAQLRAMQSYRPFDALGVLYTPSEQNSVAVVEELKQLAGPMGFRVIERRFSLDAAGKPTDADVAQLVHELKAEGAGWFYLVPDTFLGSILGKITPLALAAGLPTFGATELAVREGGALTGLISRYYSVGQLTAAKAEAILVNGQDPADIPVETLKRFSLIVNMSVARALQLYPPLATLNYAEVIRG